MSSWPWFENTESMGEDNRFLNLDEFLALVLQLRGDSKATVRDVVDMRKFMRTQVKAYIDSVNPQLQKLENEAGDIGKMESKVDVLLEQCGLEKEAAAPGRPPGQGSQLREGKQSP